MPNVFDFRFDKIFKNDALFEPAYFFYPNQPIFLPYLSVLGMLCPVWMGITCPLVLHTWCGVPNEVEKQLFRQRGTEGFSLIFFDTQSWPENGFNLTVRLKPQGFGMLRSWFYGYHFPTTEQLLGLQMQFAIFDDAKLEKKLNFRALKV